MKILIVEDETDLLEDISSYLKMEGFICEKSKNFSEAEEKIQLYTYDIILIDINLPDGSGFDLVKMAKHKHTETGIIIISAREGLQDRINGLDTGADDYLVKPFHLSELNARINSLIRRVKFEGDDQILHKELKVIPSERLVFVNEKQMSLTKKEYDLLIYFLANKNKVVTKESISEHLWGDYADNSDSFDFVYNHIKNLRRKIEDKGGNDYLKTIYGVGYKFESN